MSYMVSYVILFNPHYGVNIDQLSLLDKKTNSYMLCQLQDRFADAFVQSGDDRTPLMPPVDESQDWELLSGEEEGGFTVLEFRRDWVTCDPEDRDITVC